MDSDNWSQYAASESESASSTSSDWLVDDDDLHCLESSVSTGDLTNRGVLGYVRRTGRPSPDYPPGCVVRLHDDQLVAIHCAVEIMPLSVDAPHSLYLGLYVRLFKNCDSEEELDEIPDAEHPEWACWVLDPWVNVAFIRDDEIAELVLDSVESSRYAGHYCAFPKESTKPRSDEGVFRFLIESTRLHTLSPSDQLSVLCAFAGGSRIYSSFIVPLLNIGRGASLQWPSWLRNFIFSIDASIEDSGGRGVCSLCNTTKDLASIIQVPRSEGVYPVGRFCGIRVGLVRELVQLLMYSVRYRSFNASLMESYLSQGSDILLNREHYFDSLGTFV